MKDYLEKHFVKERKNCRQYDTIKACAIGSIDGTVTWFDDGDERSFGEYFRFGLPSKEYYSKYMNKPDFKDLNLFSPDLVELH